jgi:H+-transporting ATPase
MPIMIWIAVIIEGAISDWANFGILVLINLLNASISYYETTKAGDAVAALKVSLGCWHLLQNVHAPLLSPANVPEQRFIPLSVLITVAFRLLWGQASLKPQAYVKRDGKVKAMDAAFLVPGDLVMLASGGAVPADCYINEGTIDVDQVRGPAVNKMVFNCFYDDGVADDDLIWGHV